MRRIMLMIVIAAAVSWLLLGWFTVYDTKNTSTIFTQEVFYND